MKMAHVPPLADLLDGMAAPALGATAVGRPSVPEHHTSTIMIVDDEATNIRVARKYLEMEGYVNFLTTTEPTLVMELVRREMPDIILLDIVMPEVSGLELLAELHDDEELARIPTIVLTASDDEQIKLAALGRGATDFLPKPVNRAELVMRVRNALTVKAHHDHLKDYARELASQVRQRTSELSASRLELIHCLGRLAEFRDNETGRHVVRVGHYAGILARQLGLDEDFVEVILHAAPLHDIGKVGVPDSILLKPCRLMPEEIEIIEKHPRYAKAIFEPISADELRMWRSHTSIGGMIMDLRSSPIMAMAAQIALTHHEKWDGTGYPLGLSGESIPLAGRITAVADVFDALSSKRPYKPVIPVDKCFEEIEQQSGTHFDPRLVAAFLAARAAIVEVRMEYADID
jgi:putative two-component system response regulator